MGTTDSTTDSTTDIAAMATHHTPMVPTDTHTPMDTVSPDTTATISTRGRLRLRPSLRLRLRLIPTTTTTDSTAALHTLMADTLMATHHTLVPTATHTPMDTVDTDTTTRFLKSTLSDLIIPKKTKMSSHPFLPQQKNHTYTHTQFQILCNL